MGPLSLKVALLQAISSGILSSGKTTKRSVTTVGISATTATSAEQKLLIKASSGTSPGSLQEAKRSLLRPKGAAQNGHMVEQQQSPTKSCSVSGGQSGLAKTVPQSPSPPSAHKQAAHANKGSSPQQTGSATHVQGQLPGSAPPNKKQRLENTTQDGQEVRKQEAGRPLSSKGKQGPPLPRGKDTLAAGHSEPQTVDQLGQLVSAAQQKMQAPLSQDAPMCPLPPGTIHAGKPLQRMKKPHSAAAGPSKAPCQIGQQRVIAPNLFIPTKPQSKKQAAGLPDPGSGNTLNSKMIKEGNGAAAYSKLPTDPRLKDRSTSSSKLPTDPGLKERSTSSSKLPTDPRPRVTSTSPCKLPTDPRPKVTSTSPSKPPSDPRLKARPPSKEEKISGERSQAPPEVLLRSPEEKQPSVSKERGRAPQPQGLAAELSSEMQPKYGMDESFTISPAEKPLQKQQRLQTSGAAKEQSGKPKQAGQGKKADQQPKLSSNGRLSHQLKAKDAHQIEGNPGPAKAEIKEGVGGGQNQTGLQDNEREAVGVSGVGEAGQAQIVNVHDSKPSSDSHLIESVDRKPPKVTHIGGRVSLQPLGTATSLPQYSTLTSSFGTLAVKSSEQLSRSGDLLSPLSATVHVSPPKGRRVKDLEAPAGRGMPVKSPSGPGSEMSTPDITPGHLRLTSILGQLKSHNSTELATGRTIGDIPEHSAAVQTPEADQPQDMGLGTTLQADGQKLPATEERSMHAREGELTLLCLLTQNMAQVDHQVGCESSTAEPHFAPWAPSNSERFWKEGFRARSQSSFRQVQ